MGVSFKVSKTGTRFRPKHSLPSVTANDHDDGLEKLKENSLSVGNNQSSNQIPEEGYSGFSGASVSAKKLSTLEEREVSFTLNLFLDGYSIGKSSENESPHLDPLHCVPKPLHPYDRTSETLFSAIESGRFPGDILDDMPCRYIDGTLVCEVRDYRKYTSVDGPDSTSTDISPVVRKVCLRMSLENVVKDMPLIFDNSWNYGDMMEFESRVLKVLEPKLCLDPTPRLDRICSKPVPFETGLDLCNLRRKRLRQRLNGIEVSNDIMQMKRACGNRVPESSRLGDPGTISGNLMPYESFNAQNIGPNSMVGLRHKNFVPDSAVNLPSLSQSRYQIGVGTSRGMQDLGPVVNVAGSSSSGHDIMIPYAENVNSNASLSGKRENPDGQLSNLSNFSKRQRIVTMGGADGFPQHQMGAHMDAFNGSDANWKNSLLQQQAMARGIPYANSGIQKYNQQVFDGVLNHEAGQASFTAAQLGMRYGTKEEQFDVEKLDGQVKKDMKFVDTETNHPDLQQQRVQQRLVQHPPMRSGLSTAAWNNITQHIDKDSRKEDLFQKRKSGQSPRLSAGALVQSPLSSKSGEFSTGSMGPHFGQPASQKEKATVNSVPTVGGATSLTSSANDSMQRQTAAIVAAKRRTNSLPKTQAMSGVGSPASVSNASVPLSANSPSVGTTPPLADHSMLERFSKIEMLTTRHQLNRQKNKVDSYSVRKPNTFSPQHIMKCLSNSSSNEDFKDEANVLSKSIVGGSANICKMRVISFIQGDRLVQGNIVSYLPTVRSRMFMSEKPNDGTVGMYYGDMDDGDILLVEDDHLFTLPNTHYADLLAAQLSSLMIREGCQVEDHIKAKPARINANSSIQQQNPMGNNSAVTMQQYAEAVQGHSSNEVGHPTNSGISSLTSSQVRMLPSGAHGMPIQTRPQQLETQQSLIQQQNQQSMMQQQFPRSHMTLPSNNPLSQLNSIGQNASMQQLGNHMVNKSTALQLQLLQQQQQQQPQQQQQQQANMMQRKMMGLGGPMGMGNMANNIAGLTGLANNMGGGGRGGMGISAPMGSISGNGGQHNSLNISNAISQQIRSGQLHAAQAAFISNLKMQQNRANIMGGAQAGIGGLSGTRQMLPGSAALSMLGHPMNRPGMNPMQRTTMGPMGPPKLMPGINPYMNQQQQQQLQQMQLQHQQQLQQHETTSPLQAVVSPSQVGSPSTMVMTQPNQQVMQHASPQQMSQRNPMSPPQPASSGPIHSVSGGNQEGCPASPQVSSQTLGSVGSIVNSPMELQGVNNSNSA